LPSGTFGDIILRIRAEDTPMVTLVVTDVPDELFERLKRAAERNQRSLSDEVIACIEQCVGGGAVDAAAALAAARRLRAKTGGAPLTDEEITQAKRAGRPGPA